MLESGHLSPDLLTSIIQLDLLHQPRRQSSRIVRRSPWTTEAPPFRGRARQEFEVCPLRGPARETPSQPIVPRSLFSLACLSLPEETPFTKPADQAHLFLLPSLTIA